MDQSSDILDAWAIILEVPKIVMHALCNFHVYQIMNNSSYNNNFMCINSLYTCQYTCLNKGSGRAR